MHSSPETLTNPKTPPAPGMENQPEKLATSKEVASPTPDTAAPEGPKKLPADITEKADERKGHGNEAFGRSAYPLALACYSFAIRIQNEGAEALADSEEEKIEILKPTIQSALLTNRAMVNLKTENHGAALIDIADALELDPPKDLRTKALYRRGVANYALSRLEDALAAFKAVLFINPKDLKTRNYVQVVSKEIRYKKFCEAIARPDEPPMYERINLEDMPMPKSYDGPCWVDNPDDESALMTTDLSEDFLRLLAKYMKEGHTVPNKLGAAIVMRVINLFKENPNCVPVSVEDGKEITICGDVHGQYYDLLNIFELNGFPSESNPYIFNGDFVDRGAWGVECTLLLFALKVAYPKSFYLSRGNHETKNINKIYGFKGECQAKFKIDEMYELFSEAFMWLPLCHVINDKVFCVHGGLPSSDQTDIAEINAMNRYCEPSDLDTAEQVLLNDLLWADPRPEPGRMPSPRGVSCHFGPDVTERFLERNGLEYVVRSHEVKDDGYEILHNEKMITVFSAPNYCDMVKNKGAYMRVKAPELKPNLTMFSEVAHPSCSAMQYASPLLRMG